MGEAELATPEAFSRNPSCVWEFYHYRREVMLSKNPNPAHLAISECEERLTQQGREVTVITQNIDELLEEIEEGVINFRKEFMMGPAPSDTLTELQTHAERLRQPNADIPEQQRQRQLEVMCAQLPVMMEEQGYSAEEIEEGVINFRKQFGMGPAPSHTLTIVVSCSPTVITQNIDELHRRAGSKNILELHNEKERVLVVCSEPAV
ncbi:NAD-dependent protein deacylase sirtuin-5, mitochondrial-like [Limanda limanda]|uniref:NAD-dependent protein deacylase sirtuin-5, mitochondrial-like n=1 Tax=Limanda limanda TaxID=27771 RepID=UPI0029C745F6|nr:NAD-dependent protein deacylase sirtuin-5, mitochondrial-like [Limanda limanda]